MAKGWKPDPRFKSKFERVLDALPEAAGDGAHDALRQNGEEAKRIIRNDAPRDDGELEDSVNWTYGDPPSGVMGSGRNKVNNIPDRLRISIYAGGKKAPHAHLVHNGTAERSTESGASRGVMPPQPFFWPNIRSLRRRMKARITRKANREIKRAAK